MNKLHIKLSWVLTLCTLLTGCAFTTDKIDLAYHPQGTVEKLPGASGVKVQVTMTDKREVRDKVGKKMNGWGQEMGGIASTTDVVELVRGSIEKELTLRGFPIGDAVLISCDLNGFWNHFKLGFFAGDSIAEINVTIQVKNHEGMMVFSKIVTAQGLEPNIQIAGGRNAQPALEQALTKGIEDLFKDPGFLPSLFKAAGVSQP